MLKKSTAAGALIFFAVVMLPDGALAAVISVPLDYRTIQEAIVAATAGDEIVVGDGTYVENIDFLGKSITLRSADGPAVTTIDGDNIDHVVTLDSGEDETAVLQGFTVANGTAEYGGGIHISGASPTIRNCIITDNEALNAGDVNVASGGGIFVQDGSPSIIDCQITANHADASGGGVYGNNANLVIENAVLSQNTASWGGGIHFIQGAPEVHRCIIRDNSSTSEGGGVNSSDATPVLKNSIITGNVSRYGAGFNSVSSSPVIDGCTFAGNSAVDPVNGRGRGGGLRVRYGDATVRNCIFWANTAELGDKEIYISSADAAVTYSDVEQAFGVYAGTGNINEDPLFVDADAGDYHLTRSSPCIDAADPAAVLTQDVDGDARPQCGGVDMGADEVTPTTYYADGDGDGFGDPEDTIEACEAPEGYVESGDDCDDTDEMSFPGAPEDCDGIDNDCDDEIDEGYDQDDDGVTTCEGDCDDGDPDVTGADEDEDGYDDCEDCDDDDPDLNYDDEDEDEWSTCEGDCDDDDDSIHPGAEEQCDTEDGDAFDGVDQDCNGEDNTFDDEDGDEVERDDCGEGITLGDPRYTGGACTCSSANGSSGGWLAFVLAGLTAGLLRRRRD